MNPVYIYLEDFHLRLIELVQAASIVRQSYVDQSASDLQIGIRSGAALVILDITEPVETSGSDFIIGDITIPKGTSWATKYFVASMIKKVGRLLKLRKPHICQILNHNYCLFHEKNHIIKSPY